MINVDHYAFLPHHFTHLKKYKKNIGKVMNNVFVNCLLLRNRVFSGLRVDAYALMIGS